MPFFSQVDFCLLEKLVKEKFWGSVFLGGKTWGFTGYHVFFLSRGNYMAL